MISAILLCGGESKRLGGPKGLLKFQERSFVVRAVDAFLSASIDELIVVTGAYKHEIESEIQHFEQNKRQLKHVWNPNFKTGIMSSIQTGVREVSPQSTAFLLSLVDLPFVDASAINHLIFAFNDSDKKMGRYLHQTLPAHPVIISTEFIPEILSKHPQDHGCAYLFNKYPKEAFFLEAPRHLLTNINTSEDYNALLSP